MKKVTTKLVSSITALSVVAVLLQRPMQSVMAADPGAMPVSLSLQPAAVSIKPGGTFDVNIQADCGAGNGNMSSLDSYVQFDPRVLSVTQIISGTAIPPFGGSNGADNTAGLVTYSAAAVGSTVSGNFTVATIRFHSIGSTQTTTNVIISPESDPFNTTAIVSGLVDVTGTLTGGTYTIDTTPPPVNIPNSGTTGSTNQNINIGNNLSGTASLIVGPNGVVQNSVTLNSNDGKFSLGIAGGTILHDASGNALITVSVSAVTVPPSPPAGSNVVFSYDFGPDGANFNPSITLNMNYDPTQLGGAKEDDLYVAWWDGTQWQALTGTVDKVNHTVSVSVTHFTRYALLSKQPVAASLTPQAITPTPTPSPTATPSTTPTLTLTPTQGGLSTLTITLIFIGVALVAAILAYFIWRRRRN